MISKIDQITVYHHTDGSVAIYSHTTSDSTSGSPQKTFFTDGYSAVESRSKQCRWLEFRHIIDAAENCPALDSILQQAEITYELVKDDHTKKF